MLYKTGHRRLVPHYRNVKSTVHYLHRLYSVAAPVISQPDA
jgi:hypothetical protein